MRRVASRCRPLIISLSLPDRSTLAQLAYQSVEVVDGTSYSVITLWVPKAQESAAVDALRAEGFEVW